MPLLPSIIAGGSQVAGGLIDAFGTSRQNRLSRDFSREMYDRQFSDNLAFWRMQNEYNSPQAQMKRFQDAGLNPNLIYGQGNSGPAGAVQTPDVQSPQFRTPEFGRAVSSGGLAYVNAIYDLDIKQAQTNNLRAQNEVIKQEALLKEVQRKSVGTSEERSRFDLGFEQELRDVSADARRAALSKKLADIDYTVDENARKAAMSSSNLLEAVERMKNMMEQRLNYRMDRARTREEVSRIRADVERIKSQTDLNLKESQIKQLNLDLLRNGINPNDPLWTRIVGRFLSSAFGSAQGAIQNLPSEIKSLPGSKF